MRAKSQDEPAVATNEELEPLLDIKKVSKILGLQEKTIRDWVWRKKIAYVKCGDRVMFEPATIREFIATFRVPATAARLNGRK